MTEALEARAVSVAFGGVRAVWEADLVLGRGEILGLIGPNGAGKTTLMNVISGLLRALGGRVMASGTDITEWSPYRRARAGIARTFQDQRLFPNLTVFENAEAGTLGLVPRGNRRARTVEILDRLHLLDLGALPVRVLNHVQQRRLAIGRALAAHPKFVLLDEPGAGLSEIEVDELLDVLGTIRRDFACGLLVIGHDMRLIMRLCDRIQVLDQGSTIALGTPEQVRRDPQVIRAYLGAPTPGG